MTTPGPGPENDTRVPPPAPLPSAALTADSKIGAALDRLTDVLNGRFEHLERKVDAITALIASPQAVHAVEPAPDLDLNPVFDKRGREIGWPPADAVALSTFPLTATCRCCRQITKTSPGSLWVHCD